MIDQYVIVSIITYNDGTTSTEIIATGTRRICNDVFRMRGVVSVLNENIRNANILFMSKEQWDIGEELRNTREDKPIFSLQRAAELMPLPSKDLL
jgi:hypothetical protein